MAERITTLSGAATDVLYALFFRGALASGDLPSKSGAAELREIGFAETRHTATEYQQENYFTFLTVEGQTFAIQHLANTSLGEDNDKKEYPCPIVIGVEVDTSEAQKALDELDERIRNSEALKMLNGNGLFIENTFIADGEIQNAKISNAIEPSRPVTNIWNINVGKLCSSDVDTDGSKHLVEENEKSLAKLAESVQRNIDGIMQNALANHEEAERLNDIVRDIVRDVIRKESRPGGLLHR